MTDTNNLPAPEQGQNGEPGASPAPNGQEGARGNVPYDRFKSVNDEKNRLKAELEALKGQSQPPQNQPEDTPSPPPANDLTAETIAGLVTSAVDAALSGKLAPTIQAQDDREIAGALGINRPPSEDERKAVDEVRAQHPKLSTEEAVILAKAKSPDVFGGNGTGQGASNLQPVSRAPRSQSQPSADDDEGSGLFDLPPNAPKSQRYAAHLAELSDRIKKFRRNRPQG